jgi:hypothetical protein
VFVISSSTKRAIDLQLVRAQVLEVRERRPADAEVIERQSHTEGTQALQDIQSPLRVGPTLY